MGKLPLYPTLLSLRYLPLHRSRLKKKDFHAEKAKEFFFSSTNVFDTEAGFDIEPCFAFPYVYNFEMITKWDNRRSLFWPFEKEK